MISPRLCSIVILAGLSLCETSSWAVESVRIAVITSLSGPFALQGEEQVKAFYAAADMVNGRSASTRKFEIVPIDGKANPQESLIALKQAIDQDIRYVAVTISSVTHAISDAVVKHNARNPDRPIVLLDFNALDPALTESKCNFWHFRFEAHTDTQMEALGEFMRQQQGVHKVYLINQDYAFGQSVSRSAKEMLARKRPDVQIVADELIPLGKVKDFAPYVSKIRASGADTVLTGNWGNDLALLIKASNEVDYRATYYTLLGAFFGTPAAIGAAGADRVKTISSWHINAADPTWEKRLLQYSVKFGSTSDTAYLPPYRVLDMVARAMAAVGNAEPVKVAFALEGMTYAGPTGTSWMRPEDHQMVVPLFVMSFHKAGQAPVRHETEGTGYGWRTEVLVPAEALIPPVKCQVQRPGSN